MLLVRCIAIQVQLKETLRIVVRGVEFQSDLCGKEMAWPDRFSLLSCIFKGQWTVLEGYLLFRGDASKKSENRKILMELFRRHSELSIGLLSVLSRMMLIMYFQSA